MAAALKDLLSDLSRAMEAQDEARCTSVRELIAEKHPDTPEAAEANFRLGLTALFREQNLDEAEARLRLAAKAKNSTWSPQARTSLGLLLHKMGKTQQAVFELRKVAGKKPPTVAAAAALGLIGMIHRETKNGKEADRARADQIKMLETMTKRGEGETQAFAHYMLGMEHKIDGHRAEAKAQLEAAVRHSDLPEEERIRAQAALDDV